MSVKLLLASQPVTKERVAVLKYRKNKIIKPVLIQPIHGHKLSQLEGLGYSSSQYTSAGFVKLFSITMLMSLNE